MLKSNPPEQIQEPQEPQESKNYTIAAEIVATFSLLEKFGFDELTGNLVNLCAFLNEIGIRSSNGSELTSANIIKIFRNYLSQKEKERLLEEFNQGFNFFYTMQEQSAPKIIH